MQSTSTQHRPSSAHLAESLRILLAGLIDYAGVFPPAALAAKPTVDNYDTYRQGEHAWFLGRLVVPVARLDEFESALGQLPAKADSAPPWRLTASLGPDVQSELVRVHDFNRRHATPSRQGSAVFESVEMKAADGAEIRRAAGLISKELQSYFEIPLSGTLESCLADIAEGGARAKVRTGGVTPQVFPSCAEMARFLGICAATGAPFKASAGLHRPVRGVYRYTYAPDSPTGTMHGFLNVFLAAAFARHGMSALEVGQLLAEEAPEAFTFDQTGAAWRGRRIENKELSAARQSFCLSVGSCSFVEPLEGLRSLRLL